MSNYGLRTWDGNGNLEFDSTTDLTMFPIYSQVVQGVNVNRSSGLTINFPQWPGREIVAFMQSPYNWGSTDGWCVLSIRISYPNGIPTVLIFLDNANNNYAICDGWLTVMLTGG